LQNLLRRFSFLNPALSTTAWPKDQALSWTGRPPLAWFSNEGKAPRHSDYASPAVHQIFAAPNRRDLL